MKLTEDKVKALVFGALGIVMVLIPFINRYDTYDTELIICGIVFGVIALLYWFAPHVMANSGHYIFGAINIAFGIYCYAHSMLWIVGGFVFVIIGVYLIIKG